MSSASTYKILIIGPAWIGDMIMAQSLFKALCQQHDNGEISVMAPPFTQPLLARMPEVSEALMLDLAHGELRPQKAETFRKSSGQSALRSCLRFAKFI